MKQKINRRNFIQTAGIAALATASVNTMATNPEPKIPAKKTALKVGLMTYTLGKDWDVDTIIKNCTETKFMHVELRTTHKHGVEVTLSKNQRAEIKKKFADSAIENISLASAFRYHYTDKKLVKENIEGTKEYLQLAADVGAIGIRVFPNAFPEGVSHEQTMEQIGKALAEVGVVGNNLGVDPRVCVHGKGTNRVSVIKKIIDYSESPYVYVNWNCDHNDVEEGGLVKNFNLVKDRIKGVHMHDLFDEAYPYRQFFELLRKSDASIYCNAEIKKSCEPITLMKYYRALFLAYQNEI
ncbi:MAG: TIM barrel protein [Bacteroidota bacterium]